MGLFKMFGAGGGKLDVVLDQAHYNAGEALTGVAKFIGGKRDQTIDALTLSVNCTSYRMEQTAQGPQRQSHSEVIVPKTTLASDARSEAGGLLEIPFSFPLPATAYNTAPGVVEYRLHASADIDGEVDPGDSETFTVVGGRDYEPPAVSDAGYAQTGAAFGDFGAAGSAAASPEAKAKAAAKAKAMAAAQAKVDATAQAKALAAKQAHVASAKAAPAPAKPAPAASGHFKVGMAVMAQHASGGWFPGKVVAFQEAWIGVDWDDPKLGQSSWLQPNQLKPR